MTSQSQKSRKRVVKNDESSDDCINLVGMMQTWRGITVHSKHRNGWLRKLSCQQTTTKELAGTGSCSISTKYRKMTLRPRQTVSEQMLIDPSLKRVDGWSADNVHWTCSTNQANRATSCSSGLKTAQLSSTGLRAFPVSTTQSWLWNTKAAERHVGAVTDCYYKTPKKPT